MKTAPLQETLAGDAAYDAYIAREPPCGRELRALFRSGERLVIFDVGACEGEDSIRYSRLYPRARIFAFEPLQANQDIIRRQFARRKAGRCELVPLALSDRAGTATLHVSSGEPDEKFCGPDWNYGNKSSSLLAPGMTGREWLPWLHFDRSETVSTRTIDDFCTARGLDRVDFIHMDVQGAEWLVLQGARRMLPKIGGVWMEVAEAEAYRGQALRPKLEEFMRNSGFVLTFQELGGVEGNQFYVNARLWRGRRRLAVRGARRAARALLNGLRHLRIHSREKK
ncbi:MAG: FkbM family methyltransferase [Opitutaceae bacterium]